MVYAIHKIKKAIHPFTVECGFRIVYDFSERWEEVNCKNCLAIKAIRENRILRGETKGRVLE
jgi:hypothetical protein